MDLDVKVDRDTTTPFLLKLFYRTGAFHRPDEFADPYSPPPHIAIHTWPSATLSELAHQLAAAKPQVLPSPAIGTRLSFRLIYHDTRTAGGGGGGGSASLSAVPGRFIVKDLGSVVVGDGGPGISTEAEEMESISGVTAGSEAESSKTLADARFVVGDYISCAILPPSKDDGGVQPASAARVGRGFGPGQARSTADPGPPLMGASRHNGFGSVSLRRPPAVFGGGGGPGVLPVGEWRRGERLPEGPSGRDKGRRRW